MTLYETKELGRKEGKNQRRVKSRGSGGGADLNDSEEIPRVLSGMVESGVMTGGTITQHSSFTTSIYYSDKVNNTPIHTEQAVRVPTRGIFVKKAAKKRSCNESRKTGDSLLSNDPEQDKVAEDGTKKEETANKDGSTTQETNIANDPNKDKNKDAVEDPNKNIEKNKDKDKDIVKEPGKDGNKPEAADKTRTSSQGDNSSNPRNVQREAEKQENMTLSKEESKDGPEAGKQKKWRTSVEVNTNRVGCMDLRRKRSSFETGVKKKHSFTGAPQVPQVPEPPKTRPHKSIG